MSKFINKLVKAAGGWEKLLYQILKEVCNEIDSTDIGASLGDVYDDAKEVLTAYDDDIKDRWVDESKKYNGQPTHIPSSQVQPVVEDVSRVAAVCKPTEPRKPIPKKSAPTPTPKSLTASVLVDSEVG